MECKSIRAGYSGKNSSKSFVLSRSSSYRKGEGSAAIPAHFRGFFARLLPARREKGSEQVDSFILRSMHTTAARLELGTVVLAALNEWCSFSPSIHIFMLFEFSSEMAETDNLLMCELVPSSPLLIAIQCACIASLL